MISLETPMCVGRVRDTFYEIGHVPFDVYPANKPGTPEVKTISVSQTFEDDSGEKRWTGEYACECVNYLAGCNELCESLISCTSSVYFCSPYSGWCRRVYNLL